MKEIEIQVVMKTGPKLATVMMPETLDESVTVLGEDRTYRLAMRAYLEYSKRTLRGRQNGRKRALKIKLKELTPEQRLGLIELGFIKEDF